MWYRYDFYDDPEYKLKQALITKESWTKGVHDNLKKASEKRFCHYSKCSQVFLVKPGEKKIFCSYHCAAMVNNKNRVTSEETRYKLSLIHKLKGTTPPRKIVPKVEFTCLNPLCGKKLLLPPHLARSHKYCGIACAMKVIGSQTTSPRAARGKSGIRPDIDDHTCFYSTWEANLARIFNFKHIKW